MGTLEHQVSVVSLSNPDATAKIEAVQNEIKQSLSDFSEKESARETAFATDLIYKSIGAKILNLKVLLGGNQLPEIIDELIEMNQQITLDLNEDDHDTSQGVEIEAQLEDMGGEIEEKQE